MLEAFFLVQTKRARRKSPLLSLRGELAALPATMAPGRRRRRGVVICALASHGAALQLNGVAPVQTNRIAELRKQRAEIDAELQALEAGHRHATATPKQQIRALYDAFNARDGPAVAALLADDVVYEDLLLGESTICRGKAAFSGALEWHPAFVSKKLNLPFDLQLIVDKVACDGEKSVGVEWHVEVDGKPFPLSRGLSLATTNAEGKLERVVDIAEAPWRVVGLLIRPLLTAFGAGAAALGIGGLGYLIGT